MISVTALGECVLNRWSPTIGDPSVMGWGTVFAYGGAAILCGFASARAQPPVRVFWIGLTLILTALMINKQLDLQTALTAVGRCVSQMQGWYEDRRAFQMRFILGLLSAFVVIGVLLFWMMRRHLSTIWLALLGLVCLLCFVAIRAVGFHHFDALINFKFQNVRMNRVLELTGILMIIINAGWYIGRRHFKKRPMPNGTPDEAPKYRR